jgi:hypothetical protein
VEIGEELQLLNSAKYLFLRALSEPRDNSLRLLVDEAVVNRAESALVGSKDSPREQAIYSEFSPIELVEGCKQFELSWQSYVAYLVTEEMAGSCGFYEDENYTGTLFRIYTKSHFLDHVSRDTGGHTDPVQHFKVICLNHLIDVAAYAPPRIRVLESAKP